MIGFNPNVAGSSRLIPASGPSPGIIPTSVPMMQPANAYIRTFKSRAIWNPSRRF